MHNVVPGTMVPSYVEAFSLPFSRLPGTRGVKRYDAVVYAVGTQSDRTMGIPGEDLPGSVPAVDFVGWYNAHPHFAEMAPDISTGRAAVVGNGNVAIDVARILVTDPEVLAATDIADHALDALRERGISEVVIVGRRGPLQAAFTTLEVRELGELEGVDVIVDPADLAGISDEDAQAAGKTEAANIKVLREIPGGESAPVVVKVEYFILLMITFPVKLGMYDHLLRRDGRGLTKHA
jgi:ferredoxin--NADP+ reductase